MTRNFKSLLWLCLIFASGCGNSPPPAPPPSPPPPAPPAGAGADARPLIVAFGDSLTAGYGLAAAESYPSRLQRRLDQKGYPYRVVNAGVSGDTTAGGVRRIDWALKGDVRFLILELGANDALRGQPIAAMKKNLAQIIERAQARKVQVILAGMEAPPNYGGDYTREFREAFQELARDYQVPLIPFFLSGVGGLAEYNQQDGIHPNTKGAEVVAENVWKVIEPLIAADQR